MRADAGAAQKAARAAKAEIVVDLDLCKACGICISLCPATVFDAGPDGQAVAARPEDCTVCRLCEWHCPDFAIEVVGKARGKRPGTSEASGDPGGDAEEA